MDFSAGSLLVSAGKLVVQFGGRWLQPSIWLGFPDSGGLPALQQALGKAGTAGSAPEHAQRKSGHPFLLDMRCLPKAPVNTGILRGEMSLL
uniref:Uncharacterized protein n=1 Tax=Sciurus vulgaris TaxID=55149 RepID=A0A8D2DYT1_SCIVU